MIIPKTISTTMSQHAHDITAFFAGAHIDQLVQIAFEKDPNLKEAYEHLNMNELIFRLDIFDSPAMLIRVHHMLGIFRSAMVMLSEDVDHLSHTHINAILSIYDHIQNEDPTLFNVFDFDWVNELDLDLMRDEFEADVLTPIHRRQIQELYRIIIGLSVQFINDYEEDYQLTLPVHEPASLN